MRDLNMDELLPSLTAAMDQMEAFARQEGWYGERISATGLIVGAAGTEEQPPILIQADLPYVYALMELCVDQQLADGTDYLGLLQLAYRTPLVKLGVSPHKQLVASLEYPFALFSTALFATTIEVLWAFRRQVSATMAEMVRTTTLGETS